jgi:4-hydroxybutyryl-CoA dehydratase/vinylacetyl-CoA-Delta-isomerase
VATYKGKEEISSFYKFPRNAQDLEDMFELIYKTTEFGRGIFNIIKAIGSDALFALSISAARIDSSLGTQYSNRVAKFYEYVARNDLALAVAQTDVKWDRRKRPSEQKDPDMYVHIVKKDDNGITVRGAKAHTTQAIAANEIIVLPTRNLLDSESEYAVSFAIPASTPGLKMISKLLREVEEAASDDTMAIGKNNTESETLTIFDDVFVPRDRVFLAGEAKFVGLVAVMFPHFHRFTAISYRSALASLIIGISKLLA